MMKKMRKLAADEEDAEQKNRFSTGFSLIEFNTHFAQSNPKDSLEDIVQGMKHAGIFDDIF